MTLHFKVFLRSISVFSAYLFFGIYILELFQTHLMATFFGRMYISTVISQTVIVLLLATILIYWGKTRDILFGYFKAVDHPHNLAIFRMALFYMMSNPNLEKALFYSKFPRELRIVPYGLKALIPEVIPISDVWVMNAGICLSIFSLMAMIGLFTRFSIIICIFCALYIGGVPQLFGKINHYHHGIWFAIILAASRCADVLSVDAVFKSWRRADQGDVKPLAKAWYYALPVRFIWVLFGIIYFFPGYWKWSASGIDWIVTDNLALKMYSKWMHFPGWQPFFRIDHYPLLYKSGALFVVLFEVSFIFLIFIPQMRMLVAFSGLFFHNMTGIFMRIAFWSLQKCYVIFFNWYQIFGKIGQWLLKHPMYVFYDGDCRISCRAVATWNTLDLLRRTIFVDAQNAQELKERDFNDQNKYQLIENFHVRINARTLKGVDAFRALMLRNPLFWPVGIALYFWPVSFCVDKVCQVIKHNWLKRPKQKLHKRYKKGKYPIWEGALLVAIGSILIIGNSYMGFKIIHSWPFTVYPSFGAVTRKPIYRKLEVAVLNREGKEMPFNQFSVSKKFAPERFAGLTLNIMALKSEYERNKRLKSLWEVLKREDPVVSNANGINFYKTQMITIPELSHMNPLSRELIYSLKNE